MFNLPSILVSLFLSALVPLTKTDNIPYGTLLLESIVWKAFFSDIEAQKRILSIFLEHFLINPVLSITMNYSKSDSWGVAKKAGMKKDY